MTPPSRPDLPSVSVVIPTHDRPDFLRRAVASVLGQEYGGRVEAIVVFDQTAPVDLTDLERGQDRHIVTMTNDDRTPGPLGARNAGLLCARSDVVAFLDDDDEWLPTKLAKQVAVLRSGSADVVFTGVRYVADGRYRDYVPKLPPSDPVAGIIGGGVFLPIQSMAAWRDAMAPDLLDEDFPTGGDQELALRLVLRLRPVLLQEPLVIMNRAHTNRLTMDFGPMLANARYMERKHAALYEKYRPDPSRRDARFALLALGNRRRPEARKLALRSVRGNPRRARNWLVLLTAAALPPIGLDRLQALHHRVLWRRLPSKRKHG